MKLNELFRIAESAKNIGDYEIANVCFALIAFEAIEAKRFGSIADECDARRVTFIYEYADEDIVGALADPNGRGYYDLVAVSFHGPVLQGGGREPHYLCLPLPLLQREAINQIVRLIPADEPHRTCWVPRRTHNRRGWRLSEERWAAARRDLWRRVAAEVGDDWLSAVEAILYHEEPVVEEPEQELAPESEALDVIALGVLDSLFASR